MQNSLLKIFNLEEKKSYAIVGNSKNAGKTTVLNKLLKDISFEGKTCAVSSIGWDGETIDRVYKTEKPAVLLPEGSYAATCKDLIPISCYLFSILEDTSIETILGSIYIIKALKNLKIEIVGPRDLKSTKNLIDKLKNYADFVLLDGALSRNTSASSMITDGFIFSILYNGKDKIIDFEKNIILFYEKYKKFEIVDKSILNIEPFELLSKNSIVVGNKSQIKILNIENPIHNEDIIFSLELKPDWVYLPGALTDIVVEKLSSFFVDINIIIDDFTKNFLSSKFINILNDRNCKILYLFSSKLVGITISTWSEGKFAKAIPSEIIKIVSAIFKDYPIIDLHFN